MPMLQPILDFFVNFFGQFPPELAVLLISMTPLLEQRVALPLAIIVYQMPVIKAFALTFVGNIIPVLLVLYQADRFHAWVQRNAHTFWGQRWLRKLNKAQKSFAKYEKYGLMGLTLFVIAPIPGSGIFTGAMLAFLMGIPFRRSWPYITLAVAGSAVVTLLISVGVDKIIY